MQESSSSEDNQHTGSDDESDSEMVSSTEQIQKLWQFKPLLFCGNRKLISPSVHAIIPLSPDLHLNVNIPEEGQ